MPEKSQTITVAGYDAEKLQAIAYGALEQIGWTTRYAGENILLAYTPRNWKKYDDEITITLADGQLTVNSKMIHGESFDLTGRNKKNISGFLSAFDAVKAKATGQLIGEWKEKIAMLKDDTIKAAEQEIKQAKEVDKVMNFSRSNLFLTYGIMGINILVFILMIAGGVNLFTPTGIDIIKWGGNYGPLTLSGDWWRLITCVFVHIGIIHLAFNMYALFMVGVYLEPMLGKTRYITAYLCTGVFAGLASLWWHKEPIASAGASGAIFGMYGVFLALLSTNLIPKQIRNALLQSIAIFIVYNLVYGMRSGVDNAAHIGGLLSGFAIGYVYYPGLKAAGKKSMIVALLIAVATILSASAYLQSNKETDEIRQKAKDEVEEYSYKDADKYNDQLNIFVEAEEKALAPIRDTSLTDLELTEQLQRISLPEWERAELALQKMKSYHVSPQAMQRAEMLGKYVFLRKEDIRLRQEAVSGNNPGIITEINEVNKKIGEIIEELNKQ